MISTRIPSSRRRRSANSVPFAASRIAAVATELVKFGAEVDVEQDALTIHPPDRFKPAAIDTYDDHRMAMSFALAGLRESGVRINDPACVNKTYPNFFADFARVTGVGV